MTRRRRLRSTRNPGSSELASFCLLLLFGYARARVGRRSLVHFITESTGDGKRRQSSDQLSGERVLGIREDILWRSAFNDLASIKQRDTVAQGVHGSQIMGDKQDA